MSVLAAVYIINRLPSGVIGNKTPHEVLLGKAATYTHIRVFGCLVYARDNSKGGDEFRASGRPCIFVGYPYGQKGYRFFDLETHKIYTSRDVTFYEGIFPYKGSSRQSDHERSSFVTLVEAAHDYITRPLVQHQHNNFDGAIVDNFSDELNGNHHDISTRTGPHQDDGSIHSPTNDNDDGASLNVTNEIVEQSNIIE